MPRKRLGLGKGLDALIAAEEEAQESERGVAFVPIDSIQPNPRQPRLKVDPEALKELADSIREHGIIQPLVVAKEGEGYVLIAGERRWRAAKMAGLRRVPVVVRDATPQQLLELALIENVQRADLNPLETAEAYHQLHTEFGLSHAEIAQRVGKSRTAITNTMRLLGLAPKARAALLEGKITEGHARALLALETAEAQEAALQTVLRESLSVRQTEELVRRLQGERPKKRVSPASDPALQAVEKRLEMALGTKVRLKHGKRGGSITIYYYSDEELEALLAHLEK